MKHINFIMIAALLTLTVSCGKENKSGSKKVSSTVTNPIGSVGTIGNIPTSNLDQASNAAFNSFKAWYTSANEAQQLQPGTYEVAYSQPQDPKCKELFWGIDFCYSTSSQSSFAPTCRVQVVSGNMKANNKILASIARGQEGTLVKAMQSGSLIELSFRKADNSIVIYTVDTRMHSALQPLAQTVLTQSASVTEQFSGAQRNDYSLLPLCD